MPDKPDTPKVAQQAAAEKKSFSFGLLHGAAKGKLPTRRRLVTTPSRADGGGNPVASQNAAEVPVAYRNAATEAVAVPVENKPQPALAADRITMNLNNYFSATSGKKDLLITASAAKSLTRLFAALTIEPGSGREVPAHIRTQVLDTLVRESHILANDLCETVMEEGRRPPVYLRAKLLQQAAEFLSDQWVRLGKLDPKDLLAMTKQAFSGEVDGISQEVVDLFHQAGEYTPATEQDISDARITEAVVRANWALLRQVNHFDLSQYDPNPDPDAGFQPFTYGKSPYDVALDLTKIALSITRENALDIDHMDLATTWTQNSIDRAASLVRAEYRMLTDRALRSSFKEELMSEAAINNVIGMYDKIMSRIHERARNGFILVERNAIDAMSANAYRNYLPRVPHKQDKASDASSSDAAGQVADTNVNVSTATDPESQAAKKPQKFSFGR